MKIIAEKLTVEEYSLWNDFVNKSSQGSFFCTTEWANILSYTFDRQYEVIVLKYNDQIVAGMLTFVQKRLGYRMITPVALYPYSGPVMCDHPDKKYQKIISNEMEYNSLLAEYLSQKFKFWMIQLPPDSIDVRAFFWKNCRAEPSYSYRLHIKNWDQCQQDFNQSVRKKIRQAEKDKYSFIESEEKSSFIRMYINSYHRHNSKPLIDEQTLDKFLGMALKIPQVKLYYVKNNDEFLAARIVLEDANMVYDLLAGSDDPNGNASTFLVYKILETYAKSEFVFDFLGADHPMIEEFKRGFGGQLIHGFKITSPAPFLLSWMIKMRTQTALRSRKI